MASSLACSACKILSLYSENPLLCIWLWARRTSSHNHAFLLQVKLSSLHNHWIQLSTWTFMSLSLSWDLFFTSTISSWASKKVCSFPRCALLIYWCIFTKELPALPNFIIKQMMFFDKLPMHFFYSWNSSSALEARILALLRSFSASATFSFITMTFAFAASVYSMK